MAKVSSALAIAIELTNNHGVFSVAVVSKKLHESRTL